MDRKMFRSLIGLITYGVLLVAVVVKWEAVWDGISFLFRMASPLFIGIGIAFVLNRPFDFFYRHYQKWFRRKKTQRFAKPAAVVSVYLLLFVIIVGIFSFIIPQLSKSVQMLAANWDSYVETASGWLSSLAQYLKLDQIDASRIDAVFEKAASALSRFATGLFPQLYTFTANLIKGVTNLFLGLVFSIYLLIDKKKLMRQINRLLDAYVPEKICEKIRRVSQITFDSFTLFVSGQILEAFILGALCFIGMTIFRFDYALLISTIIAVTALIPVLGAFLGCVPAVLVLGMISPIKAVLFIVFIIVLQQIEGNLIYPKVVGSSVGLSALWVLIAILVGGGLFGIFGMLIGVPATSVLLQLLKADTDNRLKSGAAKR